MSGFRLPALHRIPSWHDRALCRKYDREDYFTTDADLIESVTTECVDSCPVCDLCLTWALETRDKDAILGGTTPRERKNALKRAHGDPQEAARLITRRRTV